MQIPLVLNKFEKESLVIKLLNEGRTFRQIATEVHISFKDIGVIARKLNGETEVHAQVLPVKSPETQALILFAEGKSQIDVAIELDISSRNVTKIYKEFLRMNRMHLIVGIYEQIKDDLRLFLKLYFAMKDNGMGIEQFVHAIEHIEQLPYIKKYLENLKAEIRILLQQKSAVSNQVYLQNRSLSCFRSQTFLAIFSKFI